MKYFSREWGKKGREMEGRLKNYLSLTSPADWDPPPKEDNQQQTVEQGERVWRVNEEETEQDGAW